MKINFDYIFKNLDGSNFGGDKTPLTLRTAACTALINVLPGQNPKPEEKVRRYSLAVDIDKDIRGYELTIEDAAFVKKCISDYYISPVLIVGQTYEVIK